jgi:Winged helix DNA-binding domain
MSTPNFYLDRVVLEVLIRRDGEMWFRDVLAETALPNSSILSLHAARLIRAGYIISRKAVRDSGKGRKATTTLAITPRGKQALAEYQATMAAILAEPKQVA